MPATCAQCGDCCEAIPFSMDQEQIKDRLAEGEGLGERGITDLTFILKNWVPISRREYENVHPEAATEKKMYTCRQFNRETRQCMVHDSRPPVCRDYPWYSRGVPEDETQVIMLPARCSFWEDVKPEWRPEWVSVEIS